MGGRIQSSRIACTGSALLLMLAATGPASAGVTFTQLDRSVRLLSTSENRLGTSNGGSWSQRLIEVTDQRSMRVSQTSWLHGAGIVAEGCVDASALPDSIGAEWRAESLFELDFQIGLDGTRMTYDIRGQCGGVRSTVEIYLERRGVGGGSLFAIELRPDSGDQNTQWGSMDLESGSYWLSASARAASAGGGSTESARFTVDLSFASIPAPSAMLLLSVVPILCSGRRRG